MTAGIYCIKHSGSGKMYIGKSVNIENRIAQHKYWLTRTDRNFKSTNRHLYNAVQKYGWQSFSVSIIERLDADDRDLIAARELHWIKHYGTLDRTVGYNLRLDSSSGMHVSDETRELKRSQNSGRNNPNFGNRWTDEMKSRMSSIKKRQHREGDIYSAEWRKNQGDNSSKFWRENPVTKAQMAKKLSSKKRKYKFHQLNERGDLIREWGSVHEVIGANPGWKWQNIYSVCNGYKKRIYGFKWKKVAI